MRIAPGGTKTRPPAAANATMKGRVVRAPGPGLRELLDVQLVQHRRDPVVDVLRPVVGVKPQDAEGERADERRAGGELVVDKKRVADARYRRSSGGEIERERVEVVESSGRPGGPVGGDGIADPEPHPQFLHLAGVMSDGAHYRSGDADSAQPEGAVPEMHGMTQHRARWVNRLAELSGEFGADAASMMQELRDEIQTRPTVLLDHLRLCGVIPERYGHDSSEEKLYSKYTDAVINEALQAIGLNSLVLDTRADSADVQAHAPSGYSLVADAKAFRLSRTAKNQKDFKVQAMDGWRHGLDHAIIVCPIYQLPIRASQIYQQAIASDVCIASFSHLAALVALSRRRTAAVATSGLRNLLNATSTMNPTKNAVRYWISMNRALTSHMGADVDLWRTEKRESLNALVIAKREAVAHLASERDKILAMSHQDALAELVRVTRFDARMDKIRGVRHGTLLDQG